MKIQDKAAKPSVKVSKLIETAENLRNESFDYLEKNFEDSEDADIIRIGLDFSDRTYNILAQPCSVDEVDRKKGMLLGPLYISEKFPQPVNDSGEFLLPIFQIDLQWVNQVCEKKLEECLLQLWWDPASRETLLRKIPLTELDDSQLEKVSFNVDRWSDFAFVAPRHWGKINPDSVFQLVKSIPIGVTCPSFSYSFDVLTEQYYQEGADDEWFWEFLQKIQSDGFSQESKSKLTLAFDLFGKFYSAQNSLNAFPYEGSLLSIGWGSGFLTIFYINNEENSRTEFVTYFDR